MRKLFNKSCFVGKVILLSTFVVLSINLSAQSSSNASGGNASGSNGTVSYSVGQITNQIHTGTTGSISEGVQQPIEIYIVNGIDEASDIQLKAVVYPNPTTDFIQLKIENESWIGTTYMLYDVNGNVIENKKIVDKLTVIKMNNLAAATYFVKVYNNKVTLKTFKVVKTK